MAAEDETDLDEYADNLANFMQLSNISVLQTSHTAVITRPSKISSIVVNDVETFEAEKPKMGSTPKVSIPKPKKQIKEQPVDIITDAD